MGILTVTLNPALDREVIIPSFKVNELHRVFDKKKLINDPGGKGINVSTMLSKLNNTPSIAMGFLGGYTGRIIAEELRRRFPNITLNFIHITSESRENISIMDEVNHYITEINAPGPAIEEADLMHFMRLFKTVVSRTKTTVISGSVPLGIPLDIYADLTKIAQTNDNKVFVEARGQLLTNVVKKNCPDVVRPDMRSTNKVMGKELTTLNDYIEAGKEIISYGAELVVISYKMKSDIIFTKEGAWLLTIMDEELDESHLMGTGDAYVTAMIHHYYEMEKDLVKTAEFGMAAALAKTKYLKKEMPPLSEINEAIQHIKTEKMD